MKKLDESAALSYTLIRAKCKNNMGINLVDCWGLAKIFIQVFDIKFEINIFL